MRNKYVIIIITLLFGCYTPKMAEKSLNKAFIKHPEIVAQKTRIWFPCIITQNDTITKSDTSFIELNCPNDTTKRDTIYLNGKTKIITNSKIIALPSKTIYVTKFVKDSANEYLIQSNINQYKKDVEKYKHRYHLFLKFSLILLLIIIIYALLRYFRIL